MNAPPFAGSGEDHNQKVLQYLVGAGLPADQVARVNANGRMIMSGSEGAPTTSTLNGYASILSRSVAGIPVPDSFAWAVFNANGEVVEEAVYWPTIPAGVIAQAKAAATSMSDPIQAQALRAKLPPGLEGGIVTIRHSPPTPTDKFEVFASYDMGEPVTPGHRGHERHFDATGVEIIMVSERRVATISGNRKR